eukprot:86413-Rhodomonas_salina.3
MFTTFQQEREERALTAGALRRRVLRNSAPHDLVLVPCLGGEPKGRRGLQPRDPGEARPGAMSGGLQLPLERECRNTTDRKVGGREERQREESESCEKSRHPAPSAEGKQPRLP